MFYLISEETLKKCVSCFDLELLHKYIYCQWRNRKDIALDLLSVEDIELFLEEHTEFKLKFDDLEDFEVTEIVEQINEIMDDKVNMEQMFTKYFQEYTGR